VFYQSQNPVFTSALCDALLAALSTRPAGALFASVPNVHLYTNNFQPTGRTPLSAFTEATFAGYALVALPTLVGPVTLPSGQEALMCDVNFIAGAVVSPGQTAFGYYLTDNANAILYVSELFTVPVPFVALGNFLDLKIVIPEPTIRSTQ
jgi:hypothetical protein